MRGRRRRRRLVDIFVGFSHISRGSLYRWELCLLAWDETYRCWSTEAWSLVKYSCSGAVKMCTKLHKYIATVLWAHIEKSPA